MKISKLILILLRRWIEHGNRRVMVMYESTGGDITADAVYLQKKGILRTIDPDEEVLAIDMTFDGDECAVDPMEGKDGK